MSKTAMIGKTSFEQRALKHQNDYSKYTLDNSVDRQRNTYTNREESPTPDLQQRLNYMTKF